MWDCRGTIRQSVVECLQGQALMRAQRFNDFFSIVPQNAVGFDRRLGVREN
jgi:hypothetical protein